MSVAREFRTSLTLGSTETYSCRLWQSILYCEIRLNNEKKKTSSYKKKSRIPEQHQPGSIGKLYKTKQHNPEVAT